MSRNSYTASERRGILAIALVALLFIAAGIVLPLCSRKSEGPHEIPVVIEHSEMIDTVALKKQKEKSTKKRNKTKTSSSKTKTKTQKSYRRRSPLDEPV